MALRARHYIDACCARCGYSYYFGPYENLYDHDPPGSPFSANGPDTCWHCEQPFEPLIVAHEEWESRLGESYRCTARPPGGTRPPLHRLATRQIWSARQPGSRARAEPKPGFGREGPIGPRLAVCGVDERTAGSAATVVVASS